MDNAAATSVKTFSIIHLPISYVTNMKTETLLTSHMTVSAVSTIFLLTLVFSYEKNSNETKKWHVNLAVFYFSCIVAELYMQLTP